MTLKGSEMNSLAGKSVRFDDQYLHVELGDGRIISTPINWYPHLKKAPLNQLARWKFICNKTGIEWPNLDYHLSIASMLEGLPKKAAA